MLQHLHIQNYALIENLTIEFSNGFVTLTGETGSGKSIILGALGLLLGERANMVSVGNPDKKCVVEGHFSVEDYELHTFFQNADIDYEKITIIRRELSPSGKSRAFVNDTPVNLTTLRALTSKLVDIHSQHQNLEIENESFQFQLVDSLAQNKALKTAYDSAFHKLQQLQRQKEELLSSQQKQSADIDYWKFQLKELQEANLQSEEQEDLEKENALLSQLENIQHALSKAASFFSADIAPVMELEKLATELHKIKKAHSPSAELAERLESTAIELKDIEQEIISESENLENNPERATYVSERLDTIYRLQQKHGKTNISELIALQESLEQKINTVENFQQHLDKVEKAVLDQMVATQNAAQRLSNSRKEVIPNIEKEVTQQLQLLGMPHAKIALALKDSENFRTHGKEHLNIFFSANKNAALSSIAKVASGGELSRLMLALKQLMAKSLVLPTLIFDEIDTGVSGEIADKMGEMMQSMGQQMQVICITHLPQIAAKAKQHWQVYKLDTTEKTLTTIEKLEGEKRTEALAKMLSGSKLTKEALANAKVLLEKP